ncbi:hypothetical protein HF086_006369 [Spodoptera exigua]|uniref:Carboxylesterase type B domain-containing protein n=1 Tax=Spodoptera exigua TaxID=7107 RepID=A0A922SL32_SPOEX|nr:hypothetical protein HF086_006369 [Spodoptera exigua]
MNKKDIIIVNFNYRLGVHGFLCLGTEDAPGNSGMKDQVYVAALGAKELRQLWGLLGKSLDEYTFYSGQNFHCDETGVLVASKSRCKTWLKVQSIRVTSQPTPTVIASAHENQIASNSTKNIAVL